MREILFRGKREDNGEWVYGDFAHGNERKSLRDSIWVYYPETQNFLPQDIVPYTLGQYTGLTDKHGVKIFEGDICRNTRTGEVVAVKWHGTMAGFVWSKRKDKSYLSEWGELFRAYDKYEIIGNIHDNPELLKGGEGNG